MTQAAVTTSLPSSSLAIVPAAYRAARGPASSHRCGRAAPPSLPLRWRLFPYTKKHGGPGGSAAPRGRGRAGRSHGRFRGQTLRVDVWLTATAAARLCRNEVGDDHRCRNGRSKSGAARSKQRIACGGGWWGTWKLASLISRIHSGLPASFHPLAVTLAFDSQVCRDRWVMGGGLSFFSRNISSIYNGISF